jgi:muramoyltetrapeptide carboxypeptidase
MSRSSSRTTRASTNRPGTAEPPPAVRPGDTIAVVASSSPFEPTPLWVGLGWLARRYRVRFTRRIFERTGYLAGSDDARLAELVDALTQPDVKAILVARGGYGLSRIVHRVDWSQLPTSPRWIVGFSDVTAMHVEAARVGIMSMHASHVGALGRADAALRTGMISALEAPLSPRRWEGLRAVRTGRAEGPWFGGNLTLLHACAAAGRLEVPEGAVVLLEDVTERPYRIDRMLTTLDSGGYFERVSAFVLGEFVGCEPGADGVRVEDVLVERLAPLGVPVVLGAPVGHGRINEPVPLGARAVVDAAADVASVRWGH